jgi:phenol 2-monooxygenase
MSPIETDVVICGSGSAGLCAAVWLAQAGINFTILESRDGPLKLGQADGVQCRTVEIFDSFNIAEELLRESCHVTELTFWATDQDTGRLVRTSRAPDTPMGISHKPHVTLNQARVNGILLEKMLSFAPDHQVQYDHQVSKVSSGGTGDRPVRVYVKHGNDEKVYHAKYALVC